MKKCVTTVLLVLLAGTFDVNAEVTNIDPAQLQVLAAQNTVIIDVRTVGEWQDTGVIDNSVPLTFFDETGKYDSNEWLYEVSAIVGNEDPVVLICHVGIRSAMIAKWLDSNGGFRNVYNASGGIKNWIDQGYPVSPVLEIQQRVSIDPSG